MLITTSVATNDPIQPNVARAEWNIAAANAKRTTTVYAQPSSARCGSHICGLVRKPNGPYVQTTSRPNVSPLCVAMKRAETQLGSRPGEGSGPSAIQAEDRDQQRRYDE